MDVLTKNRNQPHNNFMVPYSKKTLAVKKCDKTPLLKKLAEKTGD